jgi:hypothetical protein
MKKLYRKLTKDQKERNIIFSSCLSSETVEQENDNIHELKDFKTFKIEKTIEFNCNSNLDDYEEKSKETVEEFKKQQFKVSELKGNGNQDLETQKRRLLDDSFFNDSHWNYNIIRA